MAAEQEKTAAFQTAFEKVLGAVAELEEARGHSPLDVRADGLLAENVAVIANQAREGLRVIALKGRNDAKH